MHNEEQSALSGDLLGESPQVRPESVGGWLLYFCIASTFLSPLASVSAIVKAFNTYWLVCYVALVIFSICAGIATLVRSEAAFNFVRLDLIARALYGFLQMGWAIRLRLLKQSAVLVDSEFGRAVGSLLVVVIWFWYFKVSTRVKRTFGRNI